MIVLLKTKKELIHTIRSILQVFPEGVIIRSVDPVTKQTVIKFANDVANQFLRQQDDKTEILDNLMVKKSCAKQNLQEKLLEEFLKEQELKIYTEKFASTSQMVELGECKQQIEEVKQLVSDINREDLEDENAKLEHYNIKSIKVQWDNCNAFMHVFVNTTQVKKLEEERANTEYQQSMFTSLSHDMRTPLNAITNSLQLSSYIVNEMKDKIAHIQKASALCQPLFVKFERFIHIGQISSFLLLNLIEDILDMAKFKANMFKLIMSEFKLSSLLTEIDFLFCFQCIERNLKFKIVCDPDLANTTFVSDSKRISQSSLPKKGFITVTVSKLERDDETFIEFTVKDTGIGISQNDIPKLFSKFGMLKKHLKFNASGSGIGLSISKMIVESLGGNINAKSEEDQWTEFKFSVKCTEKNFNERKEEQKESYQNYNVEKIDFKRKLMDAWDSRDDQYCNFNELLKSTQTQNLPQSQICNSSVSRNVFKTKR